MRTKEEINADARVVWLEGDRLDAAAVGILRRDLVPTVEPGNELRMQVRNVLFADSSGLGLLMELRSRVGRDKFGIVEMNDRLMRCLQRIPHECRPQVFDVDLQLVPAPWDEPPDEEVLSDGDEVAELDDEDPVRKPSNDMEGPPEPKHATTNLQTSQSGRSDGKSRLYPDKAEVTA